MEIELIKDYIASFKEKKLPEIVERELKVKRVRDKVCVLIGPRRAGKTYYFFNMIKDVGKEKTLYLDFEEAFLKDLNSSEVLKIILNTFPEVTGAIPKYIFLDEIQNVRSWESLIRSLLNRGFMVFVTGSSSKLLTKEIATQLRGRSLSYLLLPFSFREYLKAKNKKYNLNLLSSKGKIKKELNNYLVYGGFPEIVLKDEKEKIIKEYLELAFFKDFIERHEMKSISFARYIFNNVIQNFSNEVSIRSIERKIRSQGIKFNITTLYKYVENLEDTLFTFFLRRFSWKVHEKESWPKKIYLCDTGLSVAYKLSKEIGKLMENAVFLELMRMTNKNPFLELFYWKDHQQREVDFVIKEREKIKHLIQVSYVSSKDEIEKREIKSLIKASEELRCKKLIVITWDYDDIEKIENKKIEFIPLWKWLLRKY